MIGRLFRRASPDGALDGYLAALRDGDPLAIGVTVVAALLLAFAGYVALIDRRNRKARGR